MSTQDKVVLFNIICTFGIIPFCYVAFYLYAWIMKGGKKNDRVDR